MRPGGGGARNLTQCSLSVSTSKSFCLFVIWLSNVRVTETVPTPCNIISRIKQVDAYKVLKSINKYLAIVVIALLSWGSGTEAAVGLGGGSSALLSLPEPLGKTIRIVPTVLGRVVRW